MYKLLTIFNTIINVILLIYFILKYYGIKFSMSKTVENEKLCSLDFFFTYRKIGWYKCFFSLRIKNAEKEKLKAEIKKLKDPNNPNVKYTLNAKCSWLNTGEELLKFYEDYYLALNDFYVIDCITRQMIKKNIILTKKQHKIIFSYEYEQQS